jgi:DNA-directed RNA polymerase subunit RPC12/RpoP
MASVKIRFRCYRCNQLLGAGSSKIGHVIQCPKCGADLLVPPPSAPGQSSDAIARAAPGSFFDAPLDLNSILPEHIRAHESRDDSGEKSRRDESGQSESSSLDSVIEFEFPAESVEAFTARVETEPQRDAPRPSTNEQIKESQNPVVDRREEIAEAYRTERNTPISASTESSDSESVVAFPFVVDDRPAASSSQAVPAAVHEPAPAAVHVAVTKTEAATNSKETAVHASKTFVEPKIVIRARDIVIPRVVVFAWSLLAILGLGFAFIAGLMIGHFLWIGRE